MISVSAFYSPAYPASLFLFGMLFAQAAAHFVGAHWARAMTIFFLLALSVWVLILAWRYRAAFWPFSFVDQLFLGFLFFILVSLPFREQPTFGVSKFVPYLPFMMLGPYVCGRLMRLSDVDTFRRVVLMAGVAMLPLLLIDRLVSQGRDGGRWAFFGQDHGALMIGALLAAALIGFCVHALDIRSVKDRYARLRRVLSYGLLCLITVFLVWVSARGWLLAGLAGAAVVVLVATYVTILRRIGLWTALLAVAVVSLYVLPAIDPQFGRLYSMAVDTSSHPDFLLGETQPELGGTQPERDVPRPVLGEASCGPFLEGRNSVAMRWVLYQEAIAMFLGSPFFGVGPAGFGEHSCTGPAGFPHSTILQGLAELGAIGGGLLIALLTFSGVTLLRSTLTLDDRVKWPANAFVLALFGALLLADQIYGNYFMATGTWLLIGVVAGMRASGGFGSEGRG